MTSIPHPVDFNMNLSAADDNMEMGTSPFRPPDDIDIEDMDLLLERSVDNSMADEAELVPQDVDIMQSDIEQFNEDDEMFDEGNDKLQQSAEHDLDMNETGELDDEEILYDDDAPAPIEAGQDIEESNVAAAQSTDATSEIQYDNFGSATAIDTHDELDTVENPIERPNETEQHATVSAQPHEENNPISETVEVDNNIAQQTTGVIDFAEENPSAEEATNPQTHSDTLDHDDEQLTSSHATEPESTINDDSNPTIDPSTNSEKEAAHPEDEFSDGKDDQFRTDKTDAIATNTPDGLHPIKVVYLGEEMSMFPPLEEDIATTFFLQDASLAHESLDRLLTSCREVLGDSLGHEDELVLDIPALGLHICEDSKFASSLTLVQITEVYTRLCINEQADSIEPLYCTLSSRVCLSTQYAYLSNAASEGRSFSEIAADYVDTPEATNETDEQPEDHETEHQAGAHVADNEAENTNSDDQEHGNLKNMEENSGQHSITTAGNNILEQASNQDTAHDHESFEESDILQAEKITTANVPDEERLTQENILTDIDNDLESDLQSDRMHSRAYPNAPESESKEVNKKPTQAIEYTEIESTEDTTSSHTLEAGYEEAEVEENVETSHVEEPNAEENGQLGGAAADDETLDQVEVDDNSVNEYHAHKSQDDLTIDDPVQHLDKEGSGEDFVETLFEGDVSSQVDQTENRIDEIDVNPPDEIEQSTGLELIDDDVTSAPITPSKPVKSKRKAPEDEEDLDFLDLSTPEPKRRRPS